jgi:hypothetical protein
MALMTGETQAHSPVGMAAGRVVFGSDNTRPDIIPDPYTNIHTHQVNRVKKWTRTHTHRVSVGYRVSARGAPRRRSQRGSSSQPRRSQVAAGLLVAGRRSQPCKPQA